MENEALAKMIGAEKIHSVVGIPGTIVSLKGKPTLCFGTMCKNEEACILKTLESVYKYIDYWVVCDTGSTDKTCEIVKDFFAEKNIPGQLYVDEWVGFDVNKSLLFERCYNKTDYILHLDADDWLMGEFDPLSLSGSKADVFMLTMKRGSSDFKASVIYNNRLRWKYIGVAHNIIKCLDKDYPTSSDMFVRTETWVDNNERGVRSLDPKKYIKDALKLKEQFFETLYDDPYGINNRSVFYCAQSYRDARHYKESVQWYKLYTRLSGTWGEELFESYMQISKCMMIIGDTDDNIISWMNKAIEMSPDRAEPYFHLGKYFNDKSRCDSGYKYFKLAQEQDFDAATSKYTLFVSRNCYGKYINDELSVSCYWTDKGEEGIALIDEIIDKPEFEHINERLHTNRKFFEDKYPDSGEAETIEEINNDDAMSATSD
jgi:glycosyltransferase involved in cell wall biosynthesis